MDDLTTLEFDRSGFAAVPLLFEPQLPRCYAAAPGGAPIVVLIDTGTDPSAIDLRLARRLGLATGGSGVGIGAASDHVVFTEAVLPWLRIGGLTIRNLFVPAIDLRDLPFNVDLVLGYNVLRQISLRIEYRTRQLIFAHPDLGAPVRAGDAVLPLGFFEQFPALASLAIEAKPIKLATLDTGSNGAISLGVDLLPLLGLDFQQTGLERRVGNGFGGDATVARWLAQDVMLGPFRFQQVPLDIHFQTTGDLGRPGRVNIGNALLARFAAVGLDYQRGIAAFSLVEE